MAKRIVKKKKKVILQKRKKKKVLTDEDLGREPESAAGNKFTFGFHEDERKTMVEIGKRFYYLTDSGLTMEDIRAMDFQDRPHLRKLRAIIIRTRSEQKKANEQSEFFCKAVKEIKSGKNEKVTSMKKAVKMGANVPEEVAKLIKAKKKAQEAGDEKESRRIRKLLRKLDYKRYKE